MRKGKVKWWDAARGYGFITSNNGQDVFLHFSMLNCDKSLIKDGVKVKFDVVEGAKGLQGQDVEVDE